MEEGDYVRTKRGTFDRFITSHTQDNLTWYTFEDRGNITNPENYIIKSSPNIIDLIEVGDYVNGAQVVRFKTDENGTKWLYTNNEYAYGYKSNEIKSIITHEQFEKMEYKL